MQDLENLYRVVNYVLDNEYHHFEESIDGDDIVKALLDDEVSHIYKDAYNAKNYLRGIIVE